MVPAMTWVTALLLDCWHCSPPTPWEGARAPLTTTTTTTNPPTLLYPPRTEKSFPFFLNRSNNDEKKNKKKREKLRLEKKSFLVDSLEAFENCPSWRIHFEKKKEKKEMCVWRARMAGRFGFFFFRADTTTNPRAAAAAAGGIFVRVSSSSSPPLSAVLSVHTRPSARECQ